MAQSARLTSCSASKARVSCDGSSSPGEGGAPDASAADLELGFRLLEEGRTDEAAALARSGLSGCPRNVEWLLLLGRALVTQGDFVEARRVLRQAMRIAPACPELCVELAEVMLRMGESDRALRTLRRAVRMGGVDDRTGALYARACLVQEQQQNDTSRSDATEPNEGGLAEACDEQEDWDRLLARAKSASVGDVGEPRHDLGAGR